MDRPSRVNIDVYMGGAPHLEARLLEGILAFGRSHPKWRFSLRRFDFKYTKESLLQQRVGGVLSLLNADHADILNELGIPWVHLLPGRPVDQVCVDVDDYEIGRMGAEHFMEKGFLRCAFCGGRSVWSGRRARGFAECLKKAGRSCEYVDIPKGEANDWMLPKETEDPLREWVRSLRPGIAVMAVHDALATRLVDLCMQEGIRVPQDVAILGVGNHQVFCELSPVPISSIDASVPQVAIQGAAILEAMLAGRPVKSRIVSPTLLAERRSTEITVYGDDLVAQIVDYIHEHVCDGVRVDDLLATFPVSRRTLTRRFSKYVGHSPAAEIRRTRLRHAQKLLQQSSLQLTDIAFTCGYSDLPHMDRAFRTTLKTTPGAFREAVKAH